MCQIVVDDALLPYLLKKVEYSKEMIKGDMLNWMSVEKFCTVPLSVQALNDDFDEKWPLTYM